MWKDNTTFDIRKVGDLVCQKNISGHNLEKDIVYSVTNDKGIVVSEEQFSKEVYSKNLSNYKLVRPGWFAYNPSRINVGSIDYLNGKNSGLVSPLYVVFEPKKELDSSYFKFYIKSKYGLTLIKNNTKGSVRDTLSYKGISNIDIPLPPLETQKKIVEILDKADALRQQDKKIIEKYDQLTQSIFLDMFGEDLYDKSTFRPISKIANFIDYRGKTPYRVENGIPLINAKCVRPSYFDDAKLDFIDNETYEKIMTRGYPRVGDVLFTTEGATMGYTCRIPKGFTKFAVGQRLITLQTYDGYNSIALEFMLNTKMVQEEIFRRATGSAAKGIRSAEFAKIYIPAPPIELQKRFAELIEKINKQKQLAQKSLKKSEILFQSLLQRAFKGELV